ARDLANLIDEIETEGSDWAKLAGLVDGNLAGWWQVTLDFLKIVTEAWPAILQERGRSDPAAHRNAAIRLEAARLQRTPPAGPVRSARRHRPAPRRRGGSPRPGHGHGCTDSRSAHRTGHPPCPARPSTIRAGQVPASVGHGAVRR